VFSWLKKIIQNIRIAFAFPSYNKERRQRCLASAARHFSTKEIELDVKKRMQPILLEVRTRFDISIEELEKEISEIELELSNHRLLLRIFERDYKEELESIYSERKRLFAEKDELIQEKQPLYEKKKVSHKEKKEAYEEVKYYQSAIDSWYSRSKRTTYLFGKKGKKIPKRSLFGQSQGDLDDYKYSRDEAYEIVSSSKENIAKLNRRIGSIDERIKGLNNDAHQRKLDIEKIKQDRQHMFDLRTQGLSREKLLFEVKAYDKRLSRKHVKLTGIKNVRIVFLEKEKHKAGVDELERKIRLIEYQKKKYIDEFDSKASVKERKLEHREKWLKERG